MSTVVVIKVTLNSKKKDGVGMTFMIDSNGKESFSL